MSALSTVCTAKGILGRGGLPRVTDTTVGGSVYTLNVSLALSRCCEAPRCGSANQAATRVPSHARRPFKDFLQTSHRGAKLAVLRKSRRGGTLNVDCSLRPEEAMWRRLTAATLLPLVPLATACTAVRPVSSPAAFIAEKGPDRVWVNQADSGVWVERPS